MEAVSRDLPSVSVGEAAAVSLGVLRVLTGSNRSVRCDKTEDDRDQGEQLAIHSAVIDSANLGLDRTERRSVPRSS